MADRVGVKPREQVLLRLPADLKARLRAAAAASQRTLNAEVIRRLERSLEESGR